MHGDVQAHAVGDDRDRNVRVQLGAAEVERLARAGHVRDGQVGRQQHAVRHTRHQPHRSDGDQWRGRLRDVDQRLSRHQLQLTFRSRHRLAAQRNTLQRIGAVGRQVGDDAGDTVRPHVGLIAGTNADGDHCAQRLVRQRVVFDEVLAQRSCADGHDNVVERAAGGVLENLEVLQRRAAHCEAAVCSDGLVPGCCRCGREWQCDESFVLGHCVAAGANHVFDRISGQAGRFADAVDAQRLGQVAHHSQLQPHAFHRVGNQVVQRVLQQFALAGRLLALPLDFLRRRSVGVRVGEHVEQDHACGAIDGGVVKLGQHGPAAVTETFDDVHLPQRASAIHLATNDARDLLGQLVRAPGRGKADVAHVVLEVELVIVDPPRVVERERHFHQLAPHWFGPADQRAEPFIHNLVRVELRCRPIVDGKSADMTECGRCLHVEKTRIEPRELLHEMSPAAAKWCPHHCPLQGRVANGSGLCN